MDLPFINFNHMVIGEAYCYFAFQFCCGVSGINYSSLLEVTEGKQENRLLEICTVCLALDVYTEKVLGRRKK